MSGNPTVCAIVPVFNGEHFVDQSLGSLAAQRRPVDEVIVIDDGSTDGSAAAAERWAGLLPLRVLRMEQNMGLWAVRNEAIDAADSELVALLDVDDIWLPDHLDAMVCAYRDRPGLITPNALKWVPGKALGSRRYESNYPVPPVEQQLEQLLRVNYVFGGTLFSRQQCLDVGSFRRWPAGCEDWDLWLRMVAVGVEVTRPSLPTVLYRLRPDSMSANDVLIETEIEVLERFVDEHDDPQWRNAADGAIASRRARLQLRKSYEAAGAARGMAARRHALGALARGTKDVRRAAAAMAVAPTRALAYRNRLSADPERSVSR